jgi:hypothetical protein
MLPTGLSWEKPKEQSIPLSYKFELGLIEEILVPHRFDDLHCPTDSYASFSGLFQHGGLQLWLESFD